MAGEQPVNPYQTPQAEITDSMVINDEGELAGRGARLGAAILDTLFVIIAMIPMFFMMANQQGGGDEQVMIGVAVMMIGLLILLAINIYFLHQNGQSIGKRILGIKIVRTDGDRAGVARIIFLRAFVIGLLGNIPIIGPIISLADPLFIFRDDRRCLHDLIADTKVIVA
jgi:uncharacterized RDD family membrane protein YckC